MGATSLWHWLVLGIVIALVFGSKRLPDLMGDLAGGIRAFKRAMAEADPPPGAPVPSTPSPDPQDPGTSKGSPSHD